MKPFQGLRRLCFGAALLAGTGFSSSLQAQTVVNVARGTSFASIQAAIDAPTTLPGDVLTLSAGTFNEDVQLTKSLALIGAGRNLTTVKGPIGGNSATIQISASNTLVTAMTITRAGNNTIDWNDPGLNSAGIAIQGLSVTNANIINCRLTGNRTGIDINNSGGHTLTDNSITDNRTGIILRNQTDNLSVSNNSITNNWTAGVLFLDASGGTNSPLQQAQGSTFSNNTISGNWYADIVDRQSGGSLPTPGTTNLKTFNCTSFGVPTVTTTTNNSIEPGYAAQIPVAYGGSAVAPGGQPNIAGPASANILYSTGLGSASIAYSGSPFCGNSGTALPTLNGSGGGTYSASPAGLSIDASTGALDIAASQPGTYTVTYGNSCGSTTTQVAIRPATGINPVPNQTYCAGATTSAVLFSGAPGLTFSWSAASTNTGVGSAGVLGILPFTATNSGSSTVQDMITVTASGGTGCSFKPMAFRYLVNPKPVLNALSDQSVCAGSSTGAVLFSSNVAGTSTGWTNNNTNTGLAAMGTGNIPSFVAVNNGSMQVSTIVATPIAGGCAGTPLSFTITTHPSVTAISYPQASYCPVGWAYATRNGSSGGTWSANSVRILPDPGTGAVNLALTPPGTYSITYTVAASGGCPASASTQLTVLPQASVDAIANQSLCAGVVSAPLSFSGTATSYTWTNTNTAIGLGASGTGTSLPSFTAANPGGGTEIAYIKVTPQAGAGTCTGKPIAFRIGVSTCPPLTHSGDPGGDAQTGRSAALAVFTAAPNPTRGTVVLHNRAGIEGPLSVQVLSAQGVPIGRAWTFSGSSTSLDLAGLTPGSYLLQVIQVRGGRQFMVSLVKL